MASSNDYCEKELYPLQDEVLFAVADVPSKFHLSGGTALSRFYFGHRYSDDLDFFLNDDPAFALEVSRATAALEKVNPLGLSFLTRDVRYVLAQWKPGNIPLKIDFITDVPSRVGVPARHSDVGCIDTPENILANKIPALCDRRAPKDYADIWVLCCRERYDIHTALGHASSKAAGIFPLLLAESILAVDETVYRSVRWRQGPDEGIFINQFRELGERLI